MMMLKAIAVAALLSLGLSVSASAQFISTPPFGGFIRSSSNVTTPNEPAIWANTAGTLLKDGLGVSVAHSDTQTAGIIAQGSPFTVYSNAANGITAYDVWACINYAACTPSGSPDVGIYDGIRSVIVANPGSQMNDVSGFTAYVINRSGASNAYPSVGFIAESIADADNTSAWGADFACSDKYTGGQVISAGLGRYCFNEIDFNFTSPSSQGVAWMAGGASLSQPADARGYQLNQLDGFPGSPGYVSYGNIARWTSMLRSNSGSTLDFAEIGAALNPGVFTGSISGTTLTVTAITSGNVSNGATLNGSGVTAGTTITALGTGIGGTGTYTVSASQTVGSETLNTSVPSQSVNFNAFDSTGTLIRTVEQLNGAAQHIINVPTAGFFIAEMGGTPVITAANLPSNAALDLATGTFRVMGGASFGHKPSAGEGLEFSYDTTTHTGFLASYDRTGVAYKDLDIYGANIAILGATGDTVSLQVGASNILSASSTGVNLVTGVYHTGAVAGITCSVVTAGATITINGGIVTAMTGC